jgi:hypothetical protein
MNLKELKFQIEFGLMMLASGRDTEASNIFGGILDTLADMISIEDNANKKEEK